MHGKPGRDRGNRPRSRTPRLPERPGCLSIPSAGLPPPGARAGASTPMTGACRSGSPPGSPAAARAEAAGRPAERTDLAADRDRIGVAPTLASPPGVRERTTTPGTFMAGRLQEGARRVPHPSGSRRGLAGICAGSIRHGRKRQARGQECPTWMGSGADSGSANDRLPALAASGQCPAQQQYSVRRSRVPGGRNGNPASDRKPS